MNKKQKNSDFGQLLVNSKLQKNMNDEGKRRSTSFSAHKRAGKHGGIEATSDPFWGVGKVLGQV